LLDDQGRSEAAIARLTTAMQCSTWLCCCNEKINVLRRQVTGGAISLSTVSPNGIAAHADHSMRDAAASDRLKAESAYPRLAVETAADQRAIVVRK
jgi:hypothetical protein